MSLSLVFALVVAVGAVAFFFGRQRAASQDNGAVKAHSRPHYHGWWAFLLATLPAVLLIIVWAIGSSVYVDRHIDALVQDQAGDAAASHGLSLSLIKGLANGLRKLDAETLAKLPQTFAELQPLLASKGVALATDTKDYMIPVAVEANTLQDRLGMIGGILALALAIAGGALRRKPGETAGAGPQQRRKVDAVGAAGRLDHRYPHDHRHRAVDAVPDDQLLRARSGCRLLLRHGLGSALRRRRGWSHRRPVRLDPAACRHALHRAGRDAGRRADRADGGGLHVRIRLAARALGGQAGA